MALKMVRASNWAHSKEVRKKRLTLRNVSFGGGAIPHEQTSFLLKWSSSTTMALFCILTLVCMLVNTGHPISYPAFEHVISFSEGKPYLKTLNRKPLDVVEVMVSKDSHSHDDGLARVSLLERMNTSTGVQVRRAFTHSTHLSLSLPPFR